MNADTFRKPKEYNKDETDDVLSESSDVLTYTDYEKPNLTTEDIDFDSEKIHFRVRSVLEGITPKQQKEIAADMFSQMQQLKAHNEILGYHGFSGLLQRHDSNMNITGNTDMVPVSEINATCKYNVHNDCEKHIAKNSLCETQQLREKLGSISMSINKIRQDLVTDNQSNANNVFDNISAKQLSETISVFQNQLTQIQDQIEDVENDIEANIDTKFLKYIQEIKINKERIQNMKKERKEKQLQISKEKEQNNIIELQRFHIDQLILTQLLQTPPPDYNTKHKSDGININLQKQKPLLSDKAFKIVGGVAIFVFGIWIISKYINGGGNAIFSSRKRFK